MKIQTLIFNLRNALGKTNHLKPSTKMPQKNRTLAWNPATRKRNLVKLFSESADKVDAYCELVPGTHHELVSKLKNVVTRHEIKKGIAFINDLLLVNNDKKFWDKIFRNVPGIEIWDNMTLKRYKRKLMERLKQVDLCITGCEYLLADVGAALIKSGSSPGRSGSLYPPHHLVIAAQSQIYPCLSKLVQKEGESLTSDKDSGFILISGPSRTADIEKTLVKGVHGPLTLTYFLLLNDKQG